MPAHILAMGPRVCARHAFRPRLILLITNVAIVTRACMHLPSMSRHEQHLHPTAKPQTADAMYT